MKVSFKSVIQVLLLLVAVGGTVQAQTVSKAPTTNSTVVDLFID